MYQCTHYLIEHVFEFSALNTRVRIARGRSNRLSRPIYVVEADLHHFVKKGSVGYSSVWNNRTCTLIYFGGMFHPVRFEINLKNS